MMNRQWGSAAIRQGGSLRPALLEILVLCLVLFLLPAQASAEQTVLEPGDVIEAFELEDQFGNVGGVDRTTKTILFSRDMEGGGIIKEALSGKDGEFLAQRHVVYVADISRMPGIVARLFAVPKMRKYDFPMLLDREGRATAQLPDRPDRGTLIILDDLRIVSVQSFADPDEIATRLEGGAG